MAVLTIKQLAQILGSLQPRWRAWLVIVLIVGFAPAVSRAEPAPSREYQIKAVFLFNFLQFVEWPDAVFTNARTPLRIGVLGDDPFGYALEETIQAETVHNRPLVVQRSHRLEDLQGCQLIFLCKSENRRTADILARLKNSPVLTVGEADGFARHGGIIAFYPDGKKVRFEINSDAAQQRGLKMSSQLLSLGKIVATEPKGGS